MLTPPETANQTIDDALVRVADAVEAPLPEEAQRLGEAQAVLQDVLRSSRDAT